MWSLDGSQRIAFATIRSLSFYRDYKALNKNGGASVYLQTHCLGKTCQWDAPSVVHCDKVDITDLKRDATWKCRAELPEATYFENATITCLDWLYPNDPYVVRGSCRLQYHLERVSLAPDTPTKILPIDKANDITPPVSEYGAEHYWSSLAVFCALILALVCYRFRELLRAFTYRGHPTPSNNQPVRNAPAAQSVPPVQANPRPFGQAINNPQPPPVPGPSNANPQPAASWMRRGLSRSWLRLLNVDGVEDPPPPHKPSNGARGPAKAAANQGRRVEVVRAATEPLGDEGRAQRNMQHRHGPEGGRLVEHRLDGRVSIHHHVHR
ncbi:hypothetical protein K474DRAFT_1661945 [Panus rudis PR-1116 ss-1]|nr:hypothetical protein K474DRAFT_1661945 [Panus rudis PR-1116 ss-1]